MKIHLINISQKMPAWVETGYQEYAKRLPSECALNLIDIKLIKRNKNANIPKLIQEEGNQMLAKIPANNIIIALDERGEQWRTEDLAKQLQEWRMLGNDISLLIGGPDGLASSCLAKAQKHWSLSRLTLPHPLVRIIVAEQLYRAWSILAGHPYHQA